MDKNRTQGFAERFANSVAFVLTQLTNTQYSVAVEAQSSSREMPLWVVSGAKQTPEAAMVIGYGKQEGLRFCAALTGDAGSPDRELTAEDEEVLREFWGQASGRASTDLKQELGDDLQLFELKKPDWSPIERFAVKLSTTEQSLELEIGLSETLVTRLNAAEGVIQGEAQIQEAQPGSGSNLDLLLDVPLSVTLRFGQKRTPLREILHLTSGAVIELDRQADEPVELLLNEKVIARGDVVVVDGCYGIRVTEVCHGQQSLGEVRAC